MIERLHLETVVGDWLVLTSVCATVGYETKVYWVGEAKMRCLSFRCITEREARADHAKFVRRLKKSLRE